MVLETVPISRRCVKPYNCALAIGIPTSQEGFSQAQENATADFAKEFLGGWTQYYTQFVVVLEKVECLLRKWGVTVIRDATLNDFADVLARPFDVVILFSHWDADAVEFHDGFAPAIAVRSAVPSAYFGILDLCVCHPVALVKELQVHRPLCIVKFLPGKAAPHYWLYFYRTLFSQLQSRDLTYPAAIEEVAGAFLDSGRIKEGDE